MSDEKDVATGTDAAADELEAAIDAAGEAVAVQVGELDELLAGERKGEPMGLASLLDVSVRVTVEVGRAQMTLGELIELGPGSLIELGRGVHEPADILVNGKIVARGEVLTIGDSYGVRITSVEREAKKEKPAEAPKPAKAAKPAKAGV